ncbi:hypothetical protein ACKWTF_002942 [Chironomus riparius]
MFSLISYFATNVTKVRLPTTMNFKVIILVLTTCVAFVVADSIIPVDSCDNLQDSLGTENSLCEINQVTIDSCKMDYKKCILYRKENYTINVDFVPKFSSDHIKMDLFFDFINFNMLRNISYSIDTEACNFMTCPIVNGIKNTYRYRGHIPNIIPKAMYRFYFMMSEGSIPKCCFGMKINIM